MSNETEQEVKAEVEETLVFTTGAQQDTSPTMASLGATEEIIKTLLEEPTLPNKEEDKVRLTHSVTIEHPLNMENKIVEGEAIPLPSNFYNETMAVLNKAPNVDLVDDVKSREWASTLFAGLGYNTYNEAYVPTLEDTASKFQHKFDFNGINLTAGVPKMKVMENEHLKGERAVIRMFSHLGLGTVFQVPLWNSGIWVTFKPPGESEIVELNRVLMSDKISLGRETYGLVLSNISAYTANRLVDFAIAHIYDMSVKPSDITIDNLKDHLTAPDLSSLLWGFICTMFPKGFKYRRACATDPEKCNYVLEDTLNVTKLQWTNTNALTDWQRSYMSSRQSKVKSLDEVKRYKDELALSKPRRVTIEVDTGAEFYITIKTPTISEYIDAAYSWINGITTSVDKALTTSVGDKERNDIILQHGKSSALRQYSHWIESIEYGSNIVDDRDTIEKMLGELSTDDQIRVKIMESVFDYINRSSVSVIGIPTFKCPKCKTEQEEFPEGHIFNNILPLDVVQLFFDLLIQRVRRIDTR